MPATAKIPGFVSQRQFTRAMKWYDSVERADDSVTDPVSQNLYSSGHQKGRKCEFLVADLFVKMGYPAQVLKGQESCDLLVKIKDKWLNVEVKSSEERKQYIFPNIKPNKFDLIVLVFVGKEGTTIQIGGDKAKEFISTWATWVVKDSDYTIAFNRNRRHCKTHGQEGIWFPFTKSNISKAI
jgi:hypothetical protein